MGEITSALMCGQPLAPRAQPCAWPLPFSSDPALSHCLESWSSLLCLTVPFYRDQLFLFLNILLRLFSAFEDSYFLIKRMSTTSMHASFQVGFKPQPPKLIFFASQNPSLVNFVK